MHKSVLLQETIDLMSPKPGGVYVDATVGAGGHSSEILKRIGKAGVLICLDKDLTALKLSHGILKGTNVKLIQVDFSNIADAVKKAGYDKVDGIIADLGVSSMQLDMPERGFSFSGHAKLDMRMDQGSELTAEYVINNYSEAELLRIFREYGEEREAKRVARKIVEQRKQRPIIWTDQLAEVVRGVMRGHKKPSRIDPATKIFQALRIEVNQELTALGSALPQMVSILKPGGKVAIISFHSLEDRIVKQFFVENAKKCICPPDYPKCVCSHKPRVKVITKKPVTATENEIRENPRSRSAKLRAAEKL
jgi:16S rRNA (cytosine1402-N4)-methyltransferase